MQPHPTGVGDPAADGASGSVHGAHVTETCGLRRGLPCAPGVCRDPCGLRVVIPSGASCGCWRFSFDVSAWDCGESINSFRLPVGMDFPVFPPIPCGATPPGGQADNMEPLFWLWITCDAVPFGGRKRLFCPIACLAWQGIPVFMQNLQGAVRLMGERSAQGGGGRRVRWFMTRSWDGAGKRLRGVCARWGGCAGQGVHLRSLLCECTCGIIIPPQERQRDSRCSSTMRSAARSTAAPAPMARPAWKGLRFVHFITRRWE